MLLNVERAIMMQLDLQEAMDMFKDIQNRKISFLKKREVTFELKKRRREEKEGRGMGDEGEEEDSLDLSRVAERGRHDRAGKNILSSLPDHL
jgi:hypothetical protein